MLAAGRWLGSCTLVHARAALVLLAGVAVPRGFAAETHTTQQVMTVSLEVAGTCSMRANDINFGNYNPNAAGAALAEAVLEVTCTQGLSYEVTLDAGKGPGATTAQRKMTFAGTTLGYGLYRDGGRQQVWGNALGVDTVQGRGQGSPVQLRVYGKIEARQIVPAGAYVDVITVRILF
jgi:spore coat protein U-like protein